MKIFTYNDMLFSLEPVGENKLAAKGSFKTGVGVRVALGLTLPSKPEARFNFRLK